MDSHQGAGLAKTSTSNCVLLLRPGALCSYVPSQRKCVAPTHFLLAVTLTLTVCQQSWVWGEAHLLQGVLNIPTQPKGQEDPLDCLQPQPQPREPSPLRPCILPSRMEGGFLLGHPSSRREGILGANSGSSRNAGSGPQSSRLQQQVQKGLLKYVLGIKPGTPVPKAPALLRPGPESPRGGQLPCPSAPTCVPLQLLYNLFCLEVPDVN